MPAKLARSPLMSGARFKGVIDMKEPDYDSYTLEQLLDVRKNIDRESYPERFHRIENILNDEEKLEKLKLAQEKVDEERRIERREENVAFNGLLIWLYGIVALSGFLITRHGSSIQIDSTITRVVIGVVLFVVGFLYLKKNLKRK